MQKTVFSSIVFLFAWTGIMYAQNVPFPVGEAIWKESHTTIAGPVFKHTALCGDTIINGVGYSQVLDFSVDNELNITGSYYIGGLRSNGGVVRFLPSNNATELLLYDFNLEAGEEVELTNIIFGDTVTRKVDSVKTEMLGGKMRKVIYFEPGYQGAPVEYWIEGIGSSFGLLGRGADPGGDIGSELLCFQHGEEYHNQTLIECFLPMLPASCAVVNSGTEVPNAQPLKLTTQPNPGRSDMRFSINQKQLPEACNLKIYAANGKLLSTIADAQPEMELPSGLALAPGFYIATLESERTERVLAHCTFVVGGP